MAYRTKTFSRYFRDQDDKPITHREGLSRWAFYKAMRHETVRYETAALALTILGVPSEMIRELIEDVPAGTGTVFMANAAITCNEKEPTPAE